METVRQLNAFEVHLKPFRHAVIFGADLRQRGLAGREVIDKRRAIFTNLRFNAKGEQQLQQRVAVLFVIRHIAQIQFCRHFTQLCFISRQRIDFQMALEGLLIGERFSFRAIQHLLQQIVDFVHQTIHVVVRAVPLQHGEFRIMVSAHLFITEATAQLIDRTTPGRQQTLHMVFRAGHQIQIHALRVAWANKTGFKRDQMNIRDRRLTHARRFHLQDAAVGKETADLRHNCCAL